MKPLRWPLIMISIIAGLIGFPLAVSGAALLVGQFALRDADGYYASTDYALSSSGSAVVLDDLHLDLDQAGAAETSRYLSARLRIQTADGVRCSSAWPGRAISTTSWPASPTTG